MKKGIPRWERYRRLLIAKRAELTSVPRTSDLCEPVCIAEEDRATILHDQFVASRIQGMDYQKLKLIDLALQRLEIRQYGICQECGEPISLKRLLAIPWATLCIACQDRVGTTTVDRDERAA